jgi:hypothetical protein
LAAAPFGRCCVGAFGPRTAAPFGCCVAPTVKSSTCSARLHPSGGAASGPWSAHGCTLLVLRRADDLSLVNLSSDSPRIADPLRGRRRGRSSCCAAELSEFCVATTFVVCARVLVCGVLCVCACFCRVLTASMERHRWCHPGACVRLWYAMSNRGTDASMERLR